MVKLLFLDVETAPNVAYVWRTFKEFVGAKQLIEPTYLMSFSAKWLDHNEVFYEENRYDDEYSLVKSLIRLLDEADFVVAHNAVKFDIPVIQGRAVALGLTPPSPFKVIDTFKVAKKHFKFPINTLEYLAEAFDCEHRKRSHEKFPGFELWLECLRQNDEAWEEMRVYNNEDVYVLEELYLKMRPWIQPHPNVANELEQDVHACPKCGSVHVHKRGFYYTQTMKYQRYHCQECGAWSRGRFTARERGSNKQLLVGV